MKSAWLVILVCAWAVAACATAESIPLSLDAGADAGGAGAGGTAGLGGAAASGGTGATGATGGTGASGGSGATAGAAGAGSTGGSGATGGSGGSAGTGGSGASSVWINEMHYDNESGDVGEGFELAGNAGASLSGWELVLYNGSLQTEYDSLALSGAIPNQSNGFGTLWFAYADIQNGDPDGVALVDAGGQVVQFLSYGGSFAASDGPAQGRTASDIGVKETGSTPVGQSLQLSGSGNVYSSFSWQGPSSASPGSINPGQSFVP